MNLDELLTNVTVIGAAGKMGSGIATLIAQELAKLKIQNPDKTFRINLIDVNEKAIEGLQKYVRTQITKIAEKTIVDLRASYESREDLVENWEIIDAFVDDATSTLRFGTDFEMARNSKIIFEAILENEELKIKILKELKNICAEDTLFFTNTSSIPIGFLDQEVGFGGKIIGYHFYNPPIVQKLVELITSKDTRQEYTNMANELGKRLGKKLVPANDVAGFIGNGHFIRDGLFAISEVSRLNKDHTFPESIYIMNRISQDFLIRPMGIFQLIDYVGIDVYQCILQVMRNHLKDQTLHSELIDQLMEKNVRGGQHADGTQKNGFLQYERNRPAGIYDIKSGDYVDFNTIKEKIDPVIGQLPEGFSPWKKILVEPDKKSVLTHYFNNLHTQQNLGAALAKKYLARSKEIGEKLVSDGVASSDSDVNAVLTNGFFWLYGPINDYV